MKLSIGLIVKNEEKYLDRCLSALLPILNSIDSELLIVDTGSKDRTVEIAKKYTDKVYFFEWIYDFAAARNYGLERATGEWFLYIDADEIFIDTDEIINFFNSNEYMKYNSGSYNLRNILSDNEQNYSDMRVSRFFKNEGIKFENAIHEGVKLLKPIKKLNCLALHYGYLAVDSVKIKRNDMIIDKILKDDPDDLRVCGYKADGLWKLKNYDECIRFSDEALKNAIKDPKKHELPYIHMTMKAQFLCYIAKEDHANIANAFQFMSELYKDEPVALIDINAHMCVYCNAQKNYEKSILCGNNYFKYLRKVEKGEVDLSSTLYYLYEANIVNIINSVKMSMINALHESGETTQLYELLNEVCDDEYIDKLPLQIEFALMKKENDFSRVVLLFESIIKQSKAKFDNFVGYINAVENEKSFYASIKNELIKSKFKDNDYVKYLMLIEDFDETLLRQVTSNSISCFWADDIFKYYILHNLSFDDAVLEELNYEKGIEIVNTLLAKKVIDCDNVVTYLRQVDTSNNKVLGFATQLAYLMLKSYEDITIFNELYDLYIDYSKAYLAITVPEKLLNDSGIRMLPKEFGFAYNTIRAFTYKEELEIEKGIKALKLATKCDESQYKLIKKLTTQMSDLVTEPQYEFKKYALQVKSNIRAMINNKQNKQAEELFKIFKELCPNDYELDELFK